MLFVFSFCYIIFFFKQKTAYEMRISDWSSDVCSSDLGPEALVGERLIDQRRHRFPRAVRARLLDRDRDREMRDAVEEIGGAVQGIDHETRLGGIAFDLAALLHDETPVGAGARQFLEQRLLGALIRHRDEIGRPLAADLEVLDLVELDRKSVV